MATHKSSNPLAIVAYSVAKGVRKNAATMRHRQVRGNLLTGELAAEETFEHDVYLMDIDRANDWMVAQGVYTAGDIRASVPSLCMIAVRDEIEALRRWNDATGGIDTASDVIVWGGKTYRILKVEAVNFWNNQPAKYRMTLRQGE